MTWRKRYRKLLGSHAILIPTRLRLALLARAELKGALDDQINRYVRSNYCQVVQRIK